jgi:hypothetical protein
MIEPVKVKKMRCWNADMRPQTHAQSTELRLALTGGPRT